MSESADTAAARDTGDQRPHVVIVGAGFGGLEAARRLKRTPVRVTVVDRRNHHLFQPLLYQVATAGLAAPEIAAPVRGVLRDQANARVLMDEVTAIDVAGRTLTTRNRTIAFDYLVLATGSEDNYFGHDAWRAHAPGLKSIDDAMAIRRRILIAFERAEMADDAADRARLLTFVLVGAGPTGVEMAGAIAELAKRALARDFRAIDPRAARIVLIDAAPRVLPGFPAPLAAYTARCLERMGVELRVDTPVDDIRADGVAAGGDWIPAETIIWCAGVKASPLAARLGAATDAAGRADLALADHPAVFVIGDAAHAAGDDGAPLPGLASVAKQQGAFVAETIRRRVAGDAAPRRFGYRRYGSLATIGRSAAVADFGWLRLTGWFAWVTWSLLHIYFLIGFRNRALVFVDWIWAYLTFGRGARLISGERAADDAVPWESEEDDAA